MAAIEERTMNDANVPPMADPLAYLVTWSTYGTWLPGDERGWVEYRHGWQLPDPARQLEAEAKMTEDACRLDVAQRELVHKTIERHCTIRGWKLHAVNCRTNHMHVVVTANHRPEVVRAQFKAWCTRRLKELEVARGRVAPIRENWWAERGSQRYVNDDDSLEAAIIYVRDGQD
jgi:hypothetical protein